MEPNDQNNILEDPQDPLLKLLNKIILFTVKCLSVLMTLVIIWSLVDVLFHIYRHFVISIESIFSVETLFSTLGSILAVLIAIEIFLNIIFFLTKDKINVSLVLATALTAIARKVIILDYTATTNEHIFAMAILIISVGLIYWLVTKKE